jgi:prolyl oligopeptidase
VLDDLRPIYLALTPGDWQPTPLFGLPAIGTVTAWRLDTEAEESDGALLAVAQDPVTPPSLLLTGAGLATPDILRRLPPAFDASDAVVTRHYAI